MGWLSNGPDPHIPLTPKLGAREVPPLKLQPNQQPHIEHIMWGSSSSLITIVVTTLFNQPSSWHRCSSRLRCCFTLAVNNLSTFEGWIALMSTGCSLSQTQASPLCTEIHIDIYFVSKFWCGLFSRQQHSSHVAIAIRRPKTRFQRNNRLQ